MYNLNLKTQNKGVSYEYDADRCFNINGMAGSVALGILGYYFKAKVIINAKTT